MLFVKTFKKKNVPIYPTLFLTIYIYSLYTTAGFEHLLSYIHHTTLSSKCIQVFNLH